MGGAKKDKNIMSHIILLKFIGWQQFQIQQIHIQGFTLSATNAVAYSNLAGTRYIRVLYLENLPIASPEILNIYLLQSCMFGSISRRGNGSTITTISLQINPFSLHFCNNASTFTTYRTTNIIIKHLNLDYIAADGRHSFEIQTALL